MGMMSQICKLKVAAAVCLCLLVLDSSFVCLDEIVYVVGADC